MDYKESLDFLYNSLPMFQRVGGAAYKAGLGTSIALAELFDNPHKAFRSIHVAGTNGKGSVSHLLASILQRAGYRVGLYTSPHLVRYPERMEICGRVVADDAFAHGVSAAAEAGRRVNARRVEEGRQRYTITPFDLLTVAALVAFAEAGVDVAVLECGMGGRWDATSAAKSIRSVAVTGIVALAVIFTPLVRHLHRRVEALMREITIHE